MIRFSWEAGRPRLSFPRLSDEQSRALALDREVSVTAGAGAGKTTTLSARFVALHDRLLAAAGHTDPASVLVLTFTERAAEEMRERCYQMVSTVCAELGRGGAAARLRAGWESLRDRFAAATISTFHGFCARVAREFAVEAGVSPTFTILEEVDASRRVSAAADGAVERALLAADPAIALLLRTFGGRARLSEAVAEAVRARGEIGDRLDAFARGAVSRDDLVRLCGVPPTEARRFLEAEWLPAVTRLLDLSVGVDTPWRAELAEIHAQVTTLCTSDAVADPLRAGTLYRRGLGHLSTGKGTPRKLTHPSTTGTKAAWGPRWASSREALGAIQAQLDGWAGRLTRADQVATELDGVLHTVLCAFGTLATDAIARYRASLDASEALDFTELQLRARRAILDPGGLPLRTLRARHRYVMVDEFQDTDKLQWSIVEALTRGEDARDRLFFVGDAKQAIYGFRGGDVEVFSTARRSLAGPSDGVECLLSINRRSRPELIAFFNGLFAQALGPVAPDRPAWEAAYEPLAPGREQRGGTVRWLVAGGAADEGEEDDGEATGAGAEAEAARAAALIAAEMLTPGGVYREEALWDTARHPSPPIALLLRTRSRLGAWEAALRAVGVPFLVLGGMGFWGRPEVMDVTNLLLALTRGDAVARVGALRSPLFGLDDQEISDLHQDGHLARFGRGAPPASVAVRPRLRAAWEAWAALGASIAHRTTAEVVNAALTGARHRWQQAWLHPDGRSLANLGRLLDLADAHDARGGDLATLAASWATQVEEESREVEAPPPHSTARVVISTVHGSKGLEYPVVVLPELDARLATNSRGALTRVSLHGRWEVACPVPDPQGAVDELGRPGFLATLLDRARAREQAEYLRLFYVGATRARDHLVLVGPRTNGGRATPRWSDLLSRWVAGEEATPEWLVLDEAPRDAPPPLPDQRPPPPAPPPDLTERIAPIATRPVVEIPPSSLGLWATDRVRWRRRHLLGVAEVVAPAPASGAPANRAAVVGRVVHGLLEDEALDDRAIVAPRWLSAAREAALGPDDVDAGLTEVEAQLETLRTSAEVAPLFDRRNYRELGVRLERPPLVLAGRLDLLCRDPADQAWMVVDYKSHRGGESDPGAVAGFRRQLLAYSVAASRVLEANGQPPVARGAILFTRTGHLVRLTDWTADDFARFDEELGELADFVAAEGADLRA